MASSNLFDSGEHRPIPNDGPESGGLKERLIVKGSCNLAICEQTLDFRGEDKGSSVGPPENRANAKRVADEMDGARVAIPDRHRELAIEHARKTQSVLFIKAKKNFDFRIGGEHMT